MPTIDIRCPVDPRRLFMKIQVEEGQKPVLTSSNLLEVSCTDCTKLLRKKDSSVVRVLHRFDILGSLVESEVVR